MEIFMEDLSDRVNNQNILSRDKIADDLILKVLKEERKFVERCEKVGIRVEKLQVESKKYRYVVMVNGEQKVPGIKRLLDAYEDYSKRMSIMAKKQKLKKGSGQRRVSTPKWVDGSPVTSPRPEYNIHKITHRINRSFSSAPVTLSEATKYIDDRIKKERDELLENLSNDDIEDYIIEKYGNFSEKAKKKYIDDELEYLELGIKVLQALKSSGKRFPKDSFRLRRYSGVALKVTATYFDDKGNTKNISQTTPNFLFIPTVKSCAFKNAFKRHKDATYIELIRTGGFDIYADYEKIAPAITKEFVQAMRNISTSILHVDNEIMNLEISKPFFPEVQVRFKKACESI